MTFCQSAMLLPKGEHSQQNVSDVWCHKRLNRPRDVVPVCLWNYCIKPLVLYSPLIILWVNIRIEVVFVDVHQLLNFPITTSILKWKFDNDNVFKWLHRLRNWIIRIIWNNCKLKNYPIYKMCPVYAEQSAIKFAREVTSQHLAAHGWLTWQSLVVLLLSPGKLTGVRRLRREVANLLY